MKPRAAWTAVIALALSPWLCLAQPAETGPTAADEAEMSGLQRRMQGEVDKRRRRINAPPGATPVSEESEEGAGDSPASDEEAVSDDATAEATVIMTLPPGSKLPPPVKPAPGPAKPPPPNVNTPAPQPPKANINKPPPQLVKPNVNVPQPQGPLTHKKEPPPAQPGPETKPGPGREKEKEKQKEKGQKPANLPPNAVENPHRPGTWGEIGPDGKFRERWGFHGGTPGKPGWGGKDHVHIDKGKQHLPPNTPYPTGP